MVCRRPRVSEQAFPPGQMPRRQPARPRSPTTRTRHGSPDRGRAGPLSRQANWRFIEPEAGPRKLQDVETHVGWKVRLDDALLFKCRLQRVASKLVKRRRERIGGIFQLLVAA